MQRFLIEISHRQNTTWQGSVKWLDENKSQNFRSALELIRLLDSTMEGEKTPVWAMCPQTQSKGRE